MVPQPHNPRRYARGGIVTGTITAYEPDAPEMIITVDRLPDGVGSDLISGGRWTKHWAELNQPPRSARLAHHKTIGRPHRFLR